LDGSANSPRRSANATERGIREIRKKAKKLLAEETEAGGMFHGLKVAAYIDPERVEELLKLAGRMGDLNRAKVNAMKEYGEDVL
jgi:hypothetical protein